MTQLQVTSYQFRNLSKSLIVEYWFCMWVKAKHTRNSTFDAVDGDSVSFVSDINCCRRSYACNCITHYKCIGV